MMRAPSGWPFRPLIVAAATLALAACADLHTENDGGVKVYTGDPNKAVAFAAAKSCCANMAEFKYVPLQLPASIVTYIETTSPAFTFPTGKSYFLAYRLPAAPQGLTLTISSFFSGDVFFPNFLFLDGDFNPLRQIGAPATHYVPPGMWIRGHYELSATLKPDDPARYMVLLTTDSDMKNRTDPSDSQVLLPAGGIYVPMSSGTYANKHGPTGKIQLVVKPASP